MAIGHMKLTHVLNYEMVLSIITDADRKIDGTFKRGNTVVMARSHDSTLISVILGSYYFHI